MAVVVFTGDYCAQCKNLKAQLDSAGIIYEEMDVMENMDKARALNVRALPTTVIYDTFGEVQKTFIGGSTFKDIKEYLND